MLVYRPAQNKEFLKSLWVVGAIIFLHFMFVPLGGYALTPAPFALILFLGVCYTPRLPKLVVLLWVFLLTLPFLNLLVPREEVDYLEFAKTYLLWASAATVILVALGAKVRGNSYWVGRAAFISLTIITIYSVAQVVLYQFFSSALLYNPFGEHQFLYQYDVLLHSVIIRAPGFYLEPSYNAFVVTSMLIITIISNYRPTYALALAAIAFLVIKALSGVLVYMFILAGYLVLRGSRKQIVASGAILVGILLAASVSGVGSYMVGRIASINVEGTSTQYRIIAPLPIVGDVLTNHFSGLPFGTTEQVLLDYGLVLGESNVGSSLDNGLYILIFYFGWIAIGAAAFAGLAGAFLFRIKASNLYVIGFLFLSLFYSGGIFSPEYIFIITLVIYAWRTSKDSKLQAPDTIKPILSFDFKRKYPRLTQRIN